MEIFMRDISYNSTKHDVTAKIAGILHSPGYLHFSPQLLNFNVRLFRDKRGMRKHSGSGVLTLPSLDVANRFLYEYGTPGRGSVIVGQRQIKFSPGRGEARPDVLESIRRFPYVDPRVLEEQERKDLEIRGKQVHIKTIQFGWDCRDSVFSIEWEAHLEDQSILYFDLDRREFRIRLQRQGYTFTVAIRVSQIDRLSAHKYLQDEPVILFFLFTPPAFESESNTFLPNIPLLNHLFGRPMESKKARQRLAALPINNHSRVAPYASLAMRLVCTSANDLREFRALGREAQFHRIQDFEYSVDRRSLFSAELLKELHDWHQKFDWCISYQIESLVRSMTVDVREMLDLIPDIQRINNKHGAKYTASMLRHFGARLKAMYWDYDEMEEEQTINGCFLLSAKEYAIHAKSQPLRPTDGSLFDSLHVIVTPTTMFLEGPFPERSNRVVRSYDPVHHDSFLRVSFVDEGRLQYRFDREVDGPGFIRSRVGALLLDGLTIAGRTFEFLAYSQSALKEHAVWFVKPFHDDYRGDVDAKSIIRNLGSFHELSFDPQLVHCPARYAARLSQAFTATDASVSVEEVEEIFYLDDIKSEDGKYVFTDGVGTMSKELAREIWTGLRATRRRARHIRDLPRAFQIRFMGSKGMLSVDYSLTGRAICLRPSMIKFEAPESREIEIARAFDRPGVYFLNRPLIMLLEGLGVPYDVFKKYQDKAVSEAQRSAQSLSLAVHMLESYGLGTSFRLPSVMLGLEKLGIDNLSDPFYRQTLEFGIHHVLRLLKNHARIPIPGAWTLVGVADAHMFLRENEIFACVKPLDGKTIFLEGPVLISRSPTIHPGDVQVVNAIGRPPLGSCFEKERLPNTVVFSVRGTRPVPSCLGGGDLDGDLYNLISLKEMPDFTPKRTHRAGEYVPAPKKMLDHPSTMRDVAEFVMEYINSDVLGIIAINWLIIADQSRDLGIMDQDCMKLAELHSDAVDYPKSGQPVALNKIPKLKFKTKPDWNAPETVNTNNADYYESQRAIGKLFRAIELPAIQHSHKPRHGRQRRRAGTGGIAQLTRLLDDVAFADDPVHMAIEDRVFEFLPPDQPAYLTPGTEEHVEEIFGQYSSELRSICAVNTLSQARSASLREEEAMIGTIIQQTSQPRKRKDMMAKLREQTDILVRGVREGLAGDDEMLPEESLERAWLAWQLSIKERQCFGAHSFGWVALGAIFEAIKEIEAAQLEESRSRFY